ncbi:MAG TPA: hypothetical protein VGP88_06380 [Thermoplasmata archaeon]|jgi:hypothetical protein|nr:hypothetical protein [Thermoplasmata archaeon]
MCATDAITMGPELALLSQRFSASRQDSIALAVLRDELEGASAEWTVSREGPPTRDTRRVRDPRGSLWVRLIGRRGPPTGRYVARTPG